MLDYFTYFTMSANNSTPTSATTNLNDTVEAKATNIFGSAISTSAPNSMFTKQAGYVSLPSDISNSSPIQTNSFYSNMLVSDQDCGVWTQPYSVTYLHATYYGLQLYHGQESDRVYGSDSPPSYYYYPTGIKELVLSSSDFSSSTSFTVKSMTKFAAIPRFSASNGGYLDCPLVQGMGFVTGVYNDLIPQINSSVGFKSISGETSPKSGINKYKITLENNTTWTLYFTIPSGQSLSLKLQDSNTIIGSASVKGAVAQLAFGTSSIYDEAAGCYPTNGTLSATVSGSTCTYKIAYTTKGSSNNGTTLMFALPHHTASFTSTTSGTKTSLTLISTTKGTMTGYLTNSFEMAETIRPEISFAPYTTISGKSSNYTSAAKSAITSAATNEVKDDVAALTNIESMYTSGKILTKYAFILYTTHFILKNSSLTNTLLPKLKTAIERFAKNTQKVPLIYDTTLKGIVTTSENDYGANYYNDHHFHYGYHIHAAAVVAKVDSDLGGTWYTGIKDWVNTLVRDVANPSDSDTNFPVYRSFDFFNGHSWAKGLVLSADGKDEELSSEDVHCWYGMKLWGSVNGDSNMENRGNLQLSILRRSLDLYFYYKDDNKVEPSKFIPNKVSGILFDNKIDYTTYFGTEIQYIHGIHMLPMSPTTSYVRRPTYVKEEWTQKLSSIIDNVTDGWKGILMLNVALYDPDTAYNFFTGDSFSSSYLDNGMSLTWSIAYCAGVGASS